MKLLILFLLCCYLCYSSGDSQHGLCQGETKDRESVIVGGNNVTIDQFPFMVLIIVTLLTEIERFCSGTIISDRFILTSANCLQDDLKNISVKVGGTKFNEGKYYNTTSYTYHPLYDTTSEDYDIGVVDLGTYIFLNGVTSTAINLTDENRILKTGELLEVTGWGSLSQNSTSLSEGLQAVSVPVVDYETCKKLYVDTFDPPAITPRMFCAGYVGKGGMDACAGDSGGPAVDSCGVQVGIVSEGEGCAQADYPGTYTNIAVVRTWLRSVIGF